MRLQPMTATGRKIHHVQREEDEQARLRDIGDGGKGSTPPFVDVFKIVVSQGAVP